MKRKPTWILALVLCITLFLSACTGAKIDEYKIPDELQSVSESLIAENNSYSLEWDDTTKSVFLKGAGGVVWATTPYEFFKSGETNYNLSSPLNIEYYNTEDGSINSENGFDCIEQNTVSAQKVKDGIKVTYYFETSKITISATYTLCEDSLKISLNTDDLTEGDVNKLLSVSVAPYLCSVKNSDSKSDYLFIPSGSGALMYTDIEPSDNPRTFAGEVYGNDEVTNVLSSAGEDEPIRMPVFGAVSGKNAICAIIENGEGAASINAIAGNPRNNYSTVYVSFNVRGYNNAELKTSATIIVNNDFPKNTEFSVRYYPLTDENASYNGFANLYREHLKNSGLLKKSDKKQEAYHLTLLGGAQTDGYILGVPYTKLYPLTTLKESKSIIEDLVNLTSKTPEVMIKGFGQSGLNTGKIAGGYKFSSKLGGQKSYNSLKKYCEDNNISLYADFDTVYYNKSGSGFNKSSDTALSANLQSAVKYPLKRSTLEKQEDLGKTFLLSRSAQAKAIEKLIDFCEDDVSGVSLSELGKTAYSDYAQDKYMMKGSLNEQAKLLEMIKNANHSVALSTANSYIAGLADSLNDVPLQNGGYDALDEQIPFYQMVYSGYIPMYSCGVNLSPNSDRQLLRLVEAGVSPSFVLTNAFNSEISTSYVDVKSSVVYENNKDLIKKTLEDLDNYQNSINGSKIVKHRILQSGVTETKFENGVSVIVNHTQKQVKVYGKDIQGMSYIIIT